MFDIPETYMKDGRKPLTEIYNLQGKFCNGFISEEVFTQELEGEMEKKYFLPVNSYKTKKQGLSLWILSGIHGEEPAGPNAIAENIDVIRKLSEEIPLVVLPLCNPVGYIKNWRYFKPGLSVGDSEHLLLDINGRQRRKKAAFQYCDALTKKVLDLSKTHPPFITLDFHEDSLSDTCYIYSSGPMGRNDPVAIEILKIFAEEKVNVCLSGKTRFEEDIINGIVTGTKDGSIDELLSSELIFFKNEKRKGPSAETTLVIETGAMDNPLKSRINIYSHIIRNLEKIFNISFSKKYKSGG